MGGRTQQGGRRLDPWELRDWNLRKELKAGLGLFFAENGGSVASPATLWEAQKVVMRGSLISRIAGKRKKKYETLERLETTLRDLEMEVGMGMSGDCLHRLEMARDEYKGIVEEAARQQYRARQHRIYETGNKSGKLLAWLARREEGQRWV